MTKTRIADHPVEDLFLNRWSPRAYDGSSMPKEDLMSVLEAARWAPSCYNIQPWRFVYALREDANWQSFHAILDEFNQAWAGDASALVFLVSDSLMPGDGDRPDRPSRYNSLDAGAAWAQMALQATLLGYQAHAMAGMDFEKAREILNVPERFRIEIAIALGQQGSAEKLPDMMREREFPTPRKPLAELAAHGQFADHLVPILAAAE